MTRAAPPISKIPFWVTKRSLSVANLVGNHLSSAIFANTLGPSKKPAWAATKSSIASEISVTSTNKYPESFPQFPVIHEKNRVQGLPRLWLHLVEEISEHQPHHGNGKRGCHICHCALARLHPRLSQYRESVAYRLDSGVCSGSQTVGTKDKESHSHKPNLGMSPVNISYSRPYHLWKIPRVHNEGIYDRKGVRDNKCQKYRHQRDHRFLYSP